MSVPWAMFDQMIRELGELVQLRDQALADPEWASSPHTTAALQALKHAVSTVAQLAEVGDRQAEVQQARRALADTRRLLAEAAKPAAPVGPPPSGLRLTRRSTPPECP